MKIGFLGTGLMGQPMVLKLLDAKISVIAYNRTESKLIPLQTAGAKITNSPTEAIEYADCLILMLTNAGAIKEVLLSNKTSLNGKTIIQMGTISPEESREINHQIIAQGGEYLEAPVLGSIPEVKSGELLVMVGGTQAQFDKWSGLLKNFSPEPMLIGNVGTAAAVKLALNQLIAGLTSTFALSLGFVENQGVEIEKFMHILRDSALYAPTFDKKLKRMSDRHYANPNFPTKHLLKDLNLFITQAEKIGLDTSSLVGVGKVVEKAIELGYTDDDYSAIYSAINH